MEKVKNKSLEKLEVVGTMFYRVSLLCAIFAIYLFCNNNASAADGNYSALTRNAALETASLNKAMSLVGSSANLRNGGGNAELNNEKITQKAQELEGVFLAVMMEPMFPEGKESNLYGGGHGNGIFRSMMLQEYGKIFADAGGVGLASGIEKQFKKQRTIE